MPLSWCLLVIGNQKQNIYITRFSVTSIQFILNVTDKLVGILLLNCQTKKGDLDSEQTCRYLPWKAKNRRAKTSVFQKHIVNERPAPARLWRCYSSKGEEN
jgi:hypothetical protein